MNFDRMRALVLEQAIQGKLVPQLESEPNVCQISEESDCAPFAIPEKWKWTKLGKIGRWRAGGTPSRSHLEYYQNGHIPWLKTGDLTDGIIESVGECITEEAVANSSTHINPIGSVLIAMYGATIGKLGILRFPCATNQACCACDVNMQICNRWYLFYYLLSQREAFIAQGAGGAQPNISRTKIVNYRIPLPPLEEQVRIVAKIKQFFEQIDLAEKAYNELSGPLSNRFRQLCLEQAIEGKLVPQLESEPDAKQIGVEPKEVPFVIPEKWKWRAFPVAVKNISAKSYQIKSSEVLRDGALPVVSQSKQRIDGYSNNKSKAIPTELLPIVIFGDHTRVTKYVNFPFIVGADGTKLLRPIHEDLTPEFLYFFVQFMSQQIRDRGYSRHFQFLKSTYVPIPPKQEQIRIVAKLKEIFDTVNAI